ncbi:hypothetical protein [Mycobacterium sp. E787]|uniref:hypothetical protein n=1 Tax=Mycobacterium sp. E787 TaxID=1834150 RepID=UPI0007FE14F8|nr:hypothetical protein [Mycobacterium sp. E787]OBI56749.1 hypothetical protein A5705_21285 [Mycobacterium sp. E787]
MSTPEFVQPTAEELGADDEQVKEICDQALINVGWCTRIQGILQPYAQAAKEAVFTAVVANHQVDTEEEIETSKAFSMAELYGELMPNGPQFDSRDINEQTAALILMQDLWGYTTGSVSGYVQRGLEEEKLVLCEATTMRPFFNPVVRRKESKKTQVRFASSNHGLVLKYYCAPAGTKYVKAAKRYQAQLDMVVNRQPAIRAELTAQAAKFLGEARKEVPLAVPSKAAQTALNSGENG